MLLLTAQREPPLTATPPLDEELTPLLDWIVLDALDESDVEVLDESLVLLVELEALEVEADVPGMVAALTAAKTPTPATAASDTPTVMRSRRRRAWSRERARARGEFVGSMPDRLPHTTEPCLRAGCEVPERRSEGGGYTLLEFNGVRRRWSRRVVPSLGSVAPGARRAH
jgi:hypothetical protein